MRFGIPIQVITLDVMPSSFPEQGSKFIYPKQDGFWYEMDERGVEKLITDNSIDEAYLIELLNGICEVFFENGLPIQSKIVLDFLNNKKLK